MYVLFRLVYTSQPQGACRSIGDGLLPGYHSEKEKYLDLDFLCCFPLLTLLKYIPLMSSSSVIF
jgi:hypothetical protein